MTVAAVGAETADLTTLSDALCAFPASRLFVFDSHRDLASNLLAAPADLVVLGACESDSANRNMLRWMRRQWPPCAAAVLSHRAGNVELTARQHGALFFLRPVEESNWLGVLEGVERMRRSRASSA